MKKLLKLKFDFENKPAYIDFGQPETPEEYEEMFRFRYEVYKKKDYFESGYKYTDNGLDSCDKEKTTEYFIAKFNGKIVGSVRLIRTEVLPTEHYFKFKEPEEVAKIPREKRAELSRLTVAPYLHGVYLPRNIVFLLLLYVLVDYAQKNRIDGGYSFVKNSLREKMIKLKMPMNMIDDFSVCYPDDGILYNYFYNQPENKVFPIYFLTDDFKKYLDNLLENKRLFSFSESEVVLKTNLYTKFLKTLKII
jgi:N-acyl-L-homoserine lactone synthetase